MAREERGIPRHIRKDLGALKSHDPSIRCAAAQNLAIAGDSRAVEPLIQTLSDDEWSVRMHSAMALGVISNTSAIEPLARALEDPHYLVRNAAVSALGVMGSRATEPLIAALDDEDFTVRREAAFALGEIGDVRAIEPLSRAMADVEWDVHRAAEKALKKLYNPQTVESPAQASEKKEADSPKRKHEHVGGEISYYGLTDWWLTAFTEEERSYIVERFQPVGAAVGGAQPKSNLTVGHITSISASRTSFLQALATWFNKPDDRYIALRILQHGEETMGSLNDLALEDGKGALARNDEGTNILDAHFLYLGMIRIYYKDRDVVTTALENAIASCEKQIAIAPQAARAFGVEHGFPRLPEHTGFKQLSIIRDKQGEYLAAIQLCEEARVQGWAGDWDKRILRYKKKMGS